MSFVGKILIVLGVLLVISGLVFTLWPRIPLLGKLPGDINFTVGGVRIFAPLVTSLIISLIATVILNIFVHLFR